MCVGEAGARASRVWWSGPYARRWLRAGDENAGRGWLWSVFFADLAGGSVERVRWVDEECGVGTAR